MSRPAALLLTPEAPYPITGGGALRAASLLHYLAQRYAVDVLVFCEPGRADPTRAFPDGLVRDARLIELPRHARHAFARALRNLGRLLRQVPPLVDRFAGFEEQIDRALQGREYEVAIVEHFWCAPYADQLARYSRKTVLDLVDIESVLHARCAAVENWPASAAHSWFHKACLELERRLLPRFSMVLATSEEDARLIREIDGATRVLVYPNTAPLAPKLKVSEQNAIVFSGNLEYHPNVSAVRFFYRAIWPKLRARWPGLVWRLVGKNQHAIERYVRSDPRVQFSGPVEDAVAELASAKVAVVPLLAGSGTRLKIVEAWAAGRAVVSTSLGAEGLPARHGDNILLADDPERFEEAVSALLDSDAVRDRIGRAGRETFERELTWQSAWGALRHSGI